ncbi:MAG: hypothetical protein ACFCU1_00725 [Sumerlaeia bacterium]
MVQFLIHALKEIGNLTVFFLWTMLRKTHYDDHIIRASKFKGIMLLLRILLLILVHLLTIIL